MSEEYDIDELQRLVDDLEEATAALREYGDENDIPAIERNAKRIEGTVGIVKQNVPGGLTDE
ncbi:MAG: hypothetical protein ABEJ80_07915 [Halarchaeum sp.]